MDRKHKDKFPYYQNNNISKTSTSGSFRARKCTNIKAPADGYLHERLKINVQIKRRNVTVIQKKCANRKE